MCVCVCMRFVVNLKQRFTETAGIVSKSRGTGALRGPDKTPLVTGARKSRFIVFKLKNKKKKSERTTSQYVIVAIDAVFFSKCAKAINVNQNYSRCTGRPARKKNKITLRKPFCGRTVAAREYPVLERHQKKKKKNTP